MTTTPQPAIEFRDVSDVPAQPIWDFFVCATFAEQLQSGVRRQDAIHAKDQLLEQDANDWLAQYLPENRGFGSIATRAGAICGLYLGYRAGHAANTALNAHMLRGIAVAMPLQGSGLAQKLLDRAIDDVDATKPIQGYVLDNNQRSQNFLGRNHFRRLGGRAISVRIGDRYYEAHTVERAVPENYDKKEGEA